MKLQFAFSFASCLRHAFMSGAGYGDLDRITEEDQRRWTNFDPPTVGSFARMETALEMPKHAANLAQWVEAALQCKNWHWDGDQFEAALFVLNDYRASIGEPPYVPPTRVTVTP